MLLSFCATDIVLRNWHKLIMENYLALICDSRTFHLHCLRDTNAKSGFLLILILSTDGCFKLQGVMIS